jgi:hypothetical protein
MAMRGWGNVAESKGIVTRNRLRMGEAGIVEAKGRLELQFSGRGEIAEDTEDTEWERGMVLFG